MLIKIIVVLNLLVFFSSLCLGGHNLSTGAEVKELRFQSPLVLFYGLVLSQGNSVLVNVPFRSSTSTYPV